MCLLFESIKIEKGIAQNLHLHQERMQRSGEALFEGVTFPALDKYVRLPDSFDTNRLIKCRVMYSRQIEHIEYEYYTPRQIRSLKIVHVDHLEYTHKFVDRSGIDRLFSQRGEADDILIIKNGVATDTSMANICFWHHERWITPATPLLKGTKRQELLQGGKLFEQNIQADEILHLRKACLINAMMEPIPRQMIFFLDCK